MTASPGNELQKAASADDIADNVAVGVADDMSAEHIGGNAVVGAARPEVIDDWAEVFRALSDSNRLRILLAVHHSPGINVTDLAEAVGMTANATSHALAALRMRGIVRSERSGRERRWSIASDQIHNLLHQVGATHSPLHPEH